MFISHDEWKGLDIFHPDDVYQDWTTLEWYDYYRYKHHYAEVISKAENILELGVRLGYSAFAFLSSRHCRTYTGLDIQLPLDGGMNFKTFDWVAEKVFAKFPAVETALIEMNSQTDPWPASKYDLIHIDGDHSLEGALKDCKQAWDILVPGGLMIVDDYTFIPEVALAVDQFLATENIPKIIGYSKRGDCLMFKPL